VPQPLNARPSKIETSTYDGSHQQPMELKVRMSEIPLPLPLARATTTVAPGAVMVPGWLDLPQQQHLVRACREWARGPVPIRHIVLPGGGTMSVQTVCLGWLWQPYGYTRTTPDGTAVAPLPPWLAELGRSAVATAYGDTPGHTPDTALVNFYDGAARMGMHQDKHEQSAAPVVSLSIGDACLFRLGNTQNRNRPYTDVRLESGDLIVFGGASRFAFHGVPKVFPGTGDPATGLAGGRLNITLRTTGLTG
jgi:alkylated DNA repair protein (DNA oxidative demethylase)